MTAEDLAEIINASGVDIMLFDVTDGEVHTDVEPIVYVNGPTIQINYRRDHEEAESK